MTLETITGNLRDGYKQLQPGTMLHVDQLMNERRTNEELCSQWFYTADGEVYFLDGARKTPALAMTREAHNPVLKNIDSAFDQLTKKHDYRVLQPDFEQALAVIDTVLIALPTLRLSKHDAEFSYLPIGTAPSKYNKLNEEERKFAERVYGQGDIFAKNMKKLKDADISETRIWVLNPDYVQKHAAEGAIARASWLIIFDGDSLFNADVRDVGNRYRVRGVRRGVLAEAFRKESHERSDLSDAQKNQGSYGTAAKNGFAAHYDAILADSEGAVKAMNDKTAAKLSQLVLKYLATREQ